MDFARIRNIALLAIATTGLSACTIYDGYGTGYYGDRYAGGLYPAECYDKDGYLYPDCEDAGYVARNGYGYGNIFYNSRYGPYGWYDGFYYPGHSFYIYDRLGNRHRWGDRHRRHWEDRRARRHARNDRRREARRDDRRAERRADRRGNRNGTRNGYRGPYPPVVTGTPQNRQGAAPAQGQRRQARQNRQGAAPAQRQGRPARQARQRSAPPPRQNRQTRQTQRMRDGSRNEDPQ